MALDLSALDELPGVPVLVAPRAPLTAFEEDPDNPRTEFDGPDFDDFVEDVRERGILQPVVVREQPGGKLRIRFGARRYRAAVHLQLQELPYVITDDDRQFDDYSQVAENEKRKGLQPMELAKFIARKISAGSTKKDVAGRLKIDPSAVTHLLSLADAPNFILELYHSRKCRSAQYLYQLQKIFVKNEKSAMIVEKLCTEAVEIDRRLLLEIAEKIESDSLPAQIQQPAATTKNETKPVSKVSNPDRIKKPLLLGNYQGREVKVILTHWPSSPGLVKVSFEDGSEEEIVINDVVLSMLTDSKAA